MVRIGVSGHRVLSERERIEHAIMRALDGIARAFSPAPYIVVSSLAEGADRLLARAVLARQESRLTVPLPLPRDEYLRDFASADSQAEFHELLARAERIIDLPPQPSREAAYGAAGRYVLEHCDVLIAVWDGAAAQGASGTGEVVVEARRRKLPLAWVHAGNRRPGTMEPTSLGAEQGKVTFENF